MPYDVLFTPCTSSQVGQCFTILSRPEGSLAAGKIANVLKFRVKEIDPTTGEAEEDGYEDEYQVGGVGVLPGEGGCLVSCGWGCGCCQGGAWCGVGGGGGAAREGVLPGLSGGEWVGVLGVVWAVGGF